MIDSVPLAGGALPTDHGDGDGRPSHNPPPATSASPDISLLPDLQALVAEHGAYSAVPPEAWGTYDTGVARWRAVRVERLRAQQAPNLERFRAPIRRPGARARKAVQA